MKKNNIIDFPWKSLLVNLLYSVPYLLIGYLVYLLSPGMIMEVLFVCLVSTSYFIFLNIFILKNNELIGVFKSIKMLMGF